MRIKNIRRHPADGRSPAHEALVEGIAALLPDGAQFAAVVLLPGGKGRFVASAEGSEILSAFRRLLDAAEAGEGRKPKGGE